MGKLIPMGLKQRGEKEIKQRGSWLVNKIRHVSCVSMIYIFKL